VYVIPQGNINQPQTSGAIGYINISKYYTQQPQLATMGVNLVVVTGLEQLSHFFSIERIFVCRLCFSFLYECKPIQQQQTELFMDDMILMKILIPWDLSQCFLIFFLFYE